MLQRQMELLSEPTEESSKGRAALSASQASPPNGGRRLKIASISFGIVPKFANPEKLPTSTDLNANSKDLYGHLDVKSITSPRIVKMKKSFTSSETRCLKESLSVTINSLEGTGS